MPAPSFSRQISMPPSRLDTPRPQNDSVPSTPYAAEVLQEYVQQSVESVLEDQGYTPFSVEVSIPPPQLENGRPGIDPAITPPSEDDVRQSVEPEYPPPNWARESTSAYEDRSLTPSPYSGASDVEMRDVSQVTLVPSGHGRETPVSPGGLEQEGSISPSRPVPPPIPETSIKQPKRGDRGKSGVQGSKVEKRSTTGPKPKPKPKPKSRNVTRKPTASVGKLVEKTKKENKETQVEAEAGPTNPLPKVGGKVFEVVKKIEEQVKQEEEKRQKDGNPVRRSQRANKGVRISLGYGSPK